MAATTRPVEQGLFAERPEGIRLIAGRCGGCEALHFPATPTCPYCARQSCVDTFVGPTATLRLFTAVASRPPGYTGDVPFGFGVVAIDGTDLEVITRLTEPRLDRLRRGMPMRLTLYTLATDADGQTVTTYAFAPADPA